MDIEQLDHLFARHSNSCSIFLHSVEGKKDENFLLKKKVKKTFENHFWEFLAVMTLFGHNDQNLNDKSEFISSIFFIIKCPYCFFLKKKKKERKKIGSFCNWNKTLELGLGRC